MIAIPGTPAAKERREACNYFFSKAAVRRIEFLVQDKEAAENHELVDLSCGFRCLAADIIVDYAYRQDFGGLSAKSFRHLVIDTADDLARVTQWATYFRRTFLVLESILGWMPNALLRKLSP